MVFLSMRNRRLVKKEKEKWSGPCLLKCPSLNRLGCLGYGQSVSQTHPQSTVGNVLPLNFRLISFAAQQSALNSDNH